MKAVYVVSVVIIFIFLGMRELPEFIEKKQKKDMIVYIFISLFALTFSVLLIIGVEVPSHIKIIQYVIEDVLKIGYKAE